MSFLVDGILESMGNAMIDAGATRIGTSSSIKILEGWDKAHI